MTNSLKQYLIYFTGMRVGKNLPTILYCLFVASLGTIYTKKTGPWNGHSLVIFPSWKPQGISKYDYNTICLT